MGSIKNGIVLMTFLLVIPLAVSAKEIKNNISKYSEKSLMLNYKRDIKNIEQFVYVGIVLIPHEHYKIKTSKEKINLEKLTIYLKNTVRAEFQGIKIKEFGGKIDAPGKGNVNLNIYYQMDVHPFVYHLELTLGHGANDLIYRSYMFSAENIPIAEEYIKKVIVDGIKDIANEFKQVRSGL